MSESPTVQKRESKAPNETARNTPLLGHAKTTAVQLLLYDAAERAAAQHLDAVVATRRVEGEAVGKRPAGINPDLPW